jgi:hypothetical protein
VFSVIIPKLHFLQIKRKLLLEDPMELNDFLFCLAPESFKAVIVDFSLGKSLPMVDPDVPVSTEHQKIIASEFVRIHNSVSS